MRKHDYEEKRTHMSEMQTVEKQQQQNKHNAELQRPDPGTKKTWGNLVPGPYFPTQYPKWIFIICIVLAGKKTH